MTQWNFNLDEAPRDGTWILILGEFNTPACVYWSTYKYMNGEEFGWTYDGGDRFNPKAWCPVTDADEKTMNYYQN